MKKIKGNALWLVVLFLLISVSAWAIEVTAPRYTVTLLSAVNAIGNGTGKDYDNTYSKINCQAWRTGTGTITLNVQGNINGTSSAFANLTSTHSVTTDLDTMVFHINNKSVRYLRGQCLTGCDATNALTLKCTAGGE